MLTIFAMAAASVAGALVTLSRVIGWKRVKKHATVVDVSFTAFLAMFLAGTLGGALVAVLGGLIMALFLSVAVYLPRKLGELKDRVRGAFAPARPAGTDDVEWNENGWVYNQAPYVCTRY